MLCIIVKTTSRQSALLVFSVITSAERALVFSIACVTLLRVAPGYFDTAENELSEVEKLTMLAIRMNWS